MPSVIRYPSSDRRAIIIWLTLCLLLVASMVLIGGYTRLSGSGLSITSWKPIHGVIPPMNDVQWQEEFSAYQASPQYQKVNSGMSLDEFKTIFWPEFIHRLLGRLIGVVFFLPFIVFAMRRRLNRALMWRLSGIFALGGLQGLIGWLMVKSGLVDDPNVSPLRLALHLSVAFAIFALILWTLLDILSSPSPLAGEGRDGGAIGLISKPSLPNPPPQGVRGFYLLWFIGLCLQIVMGALMAGNHAGLIYNTWPTMNGQWLPDGAWDASPWYANLIMIQLIHRNLAILLAVSYLFLWRTIRKHGRNTQPKAVETLVALLLATQFALGILTLLHQVPLPLALAHQMTGLLLFATAVVLLHKVVSH